MVIIKRNYSEYNVDLESLNFFEKCEFRVRVYEYKIEHMIGKYEAVFNYSFKETEEHQYDPVDEIKLEEYYSYFSSFGTTEKEALDKLYYSLNIRENLLFMKKNKNKIKIMF